MNRLIISSVVVLGLLVGAMPSQAHIRPSWHCHQYSTEYVRCHRALTGKLVPLGSGDIRCAHISRKVYYDEDARPYVAKRGPGCHILRVYLDR